MNKYHNKKTVVDGEQFPSRREANRWRELQFMHKAGIITRLERQVAFELVPKQKDPSGKAVRAVTYIADFVYYRDGQMVVEDSKGFATPEFKIKKKLMLWLKGIWVNEV